jgi:hypothetical protein
LRHRILSESGSISAILIDDVSVLFENNRIPAGDKAGFALQARLTKMYVRRFSAYCGLSGVIAKRHRYPACYETIIVGALDRIRARRIAPCAIIRREFQ